jgi:Tol biopolymer transport system component
VTGAVLHQGGREIPLLRIDETLAKSIAALPKGHPMPRTWPVMAGIAPRLLTNGEMLDYWPAFSPDGKTVLFSRSADQGKNWTLVRVPASGGTAEAFAKEPLPVIATRADWSAHDLIAFTGTTIARKSGIWLINGDGSGAHAVTVPDGTHEMIYPSWYSDGKSLAVLADDNQTIRRLDLAAGTTTGITDRAQVLTGMPSVSPDGETIAFAGQKNEGQRYDQEENWIWLVGSGPATPLEMPPLQGRAPVWSPDGKRVAFESDRGNPDGHYAVFLINRDGSELVQVTDFALDATHPVFSRDGRHLVFAYVTRGGKGSGIAILDLP